MSHTFSPTKNFHLNGFTGNTASTQHHLAIQTPEAESASHHFFNAEEMG
jgi:hypothetical protein